MSVAKNATKNSRTLRYDALNSYVGHLSVTTTAGKKTEVKNYRTTRDGADCDLFEVWHFAGETAEGEPESYRVCIRAGQESCGCKGHEYRKGGAFCRHVAALKKLRSLGRV